VIFVSSQSSKPFGVLAQSLLQVIQNFVQLEKFGCGHGLGAQSLNPVMRRRAPVDEDVGLIAMEARY
jgi:hypothetical protein